MTNAPPRTQPPPSPRAGPSVLPPLSKFYCGPAQGWNSAEASPSHNGSTWSLISPQNEASPALAPRISPAPPGSSNHWQNRSVNAHEESQGWQNLPPPHSPVNPGWDSRPASSLIDTTTWGTNHKHKNLEIPRSDSPPTLPPRPSNATNHTRPSRDQSLKRLSPSSKYSSQHYSARGSATTIDVPLFLQPQSFDPETAPPLPERPLSPARSLQNPAPSASLPPKIPPSHPPKIPMSFSGAAYDASQSAWSGHRREASQDIHSRDARRPRFDPQNSVDLGHRKQDSQGSAGSAGSRKRPRFDPQNSHDDRNHQALWQSRDGQSPSISHSHGEYKDENRRQPGQRLQQDSVSPVHEHERWPAGHVPTRWDLPAGYAPSPELQHTIVPQQDGRSTTTTDVSSNIPAASTPESHQTSNTSYKGSEARAEPSNYEEESNDSFYWHSGRSSSEGEDERGKNAASANPRSSRQNPTIDMRSDYDSASTARENSLDTTVTNSRNSRTASKIIQGKSQDRTQSHVEYEVRGLPMRSSSLSPNPAVSYTASALGFGGPSDWEYFGDYEAEEIDDEELYAHKPRAELPADYLQSGGTDSGPTDLVDSGTATPHQFTAPNSSLTRNNDPQIQHSQSSNRAMEETSVLASKWSPSTTTPTTPHANPSRPITVTSEPLPTEDHRPDLDEVIRAWSDSPYVGRASDVDLPKHAELRPFENHDTAAEASLASTPGENVLGIHAIPKDAPPIPKLPDPIDLELSSLSNNVLESQSSHNQDTAPSQFIENKKLLVDAKVVEDAKVIESTRETSTRTPSSHRGTTDATPSVVSENEPDEPLDHLKTVMMHSNPRVNRDMEHTPANDSPNHHEDVMVNHPTDIAQDTSEDLPNEVPNHHDDLTMNDTSDETGNAPSVLNASIPQAMNSQPNRTDSVRNRSDSPSTVSSHQSMEKPLHYPDAVHPGLGRTCSPLSEFARKRQMFEVSADKKPPHSPLQRKPLPFKDTKQIANDLPSTEDKTITGFSDSSVPDRSQLPSKTPSAHGSFQVTRRNTPSISSYPSSDGLRRPSREIILPRSTSPSENMDPGTSTPTSAPSSHDGTCKQGTVAEPQPTVFSSVENDPPHLEPPGAVSLDDSKGTESHDEARSSLAIVHQNAKTEETDSSNSEASQTPSGLSKNDHHVTTDRVNETQTQLEGPSEEKCLSKLEATDDPYADLDPWGRASLNRFAAMLREEVRAELNKDKLNIFNVFTTRESRLRVVLYGSDEELILSQKTPELARKESQKSPSQKLQHLARASSMKKVVQQTSTILKHQRTVKELPPLPPKHGKVVGPPVSSLAPLVINTNNSTQSDLDTLSKPLESPKFSPDGRPIVQRQLRNSMEFVQQQGESSVDGDSMNSKLGKDAKDGASYAKTPILVSDLDVIKDDNPTYARPKFNEKGEEVKNYLTNRRSIYRPFATQTAESMETAKNFGSEPGIPTGPPPVPYSSWTITENINNATKSASATSDMHKSLDLRRFVEADFDPLIMILPESQAILEDSRSLAELKNAMDAVPDDFSFIHGSVVSWDTKVKRQREENERERHARQIESEQRIDALFDDHEIGYGDIAELEGEFKQSEAAKKAEEDRSEYQTFVNDVFNLVWTRLNYELDLLKPHYEGYSKLMNDTLAGKDVFDSPESLALAPTMTAFLGLHQKLEIRYQKAFEAVLERDRRLKKTEISPWYSLSNIDKVKQLEKQFEDAEKQAIIGYCEQRDSRANKLMDVLDQNTLRGVGANQDYMEAIMKAIRRIASGRAFASQPGADGPTFGIDLVEKAKAMTALVAASSEQIVQTFHVADMLLNNADYEVSVAKEKVARADTATLAKLKEERAKEDQKLMRDLEHRLALIREDFRRTNDEIIKLMLFLGVQNGRAFTAQPAPAALGVRKQQQEEGDAMTGAPDPDREAQMQQALEEAERRNAVKENGG